MRLHTKMFLVWGGFSLVLWAAALALIGRSMDDGFSRLAADSFATVRHGLAAVQEGRVARVRQASAMLMSIPELRALIAENNYEVSDTNVASLRERLDTLAVLADVDFVGVLDGHGEVVAKNGGSLWADLAALRHYAKATPEATALIEEVFSPVARNRGVYGLWPVGGRLCQVVGIPLVFDASDPNAEPDGAILMAIPFTNAVATELGRAHGCQLTFMSTDQHVMASSFAAAPEDAMTTSGGAVQLGGLPYRVSSEPLIDPCSKRIVGSLVIHSEQSASASIRSRVTRTLALALVGGLAMVAVGSWVVGRAVTRPVQRLSADVDRVAAGDLNLAVPPPGGGEVGSLARAFYGMVQQVRQRQELERQVEESRAAAAAKSELLATMSHEIRTPLAGVIGMADLLLASGLGEKQRRQVDLIRSSADMLTTMMSDALDLAKIEAGKMELEQIAFDPGDLALQAAELFTPRMTAKGLNIQCEIDPAVPGRVSGDPGRVRQILLNFLSNALKFTAQGGITVTVDSARDGRLRFAVRDTGMGIPADKLDRLFKSFSQVDASTNRKFGGTGLGLSICKQLAALMGGTVGVASHAGEGSTFWFEVTVAILDPARVTAAPVASEARSAQSPAAAVRRSERLLVADDYEINRLLVVDLLTEEGFTCDAVADGLAAVRAIESGQYALALLDCQMPGLDGPSAASQIRSSETARGTIGRTKLVALTAGDDRDRARCLSAGMDAFCTKPIDRNVLLATLARLLPPTVSQTALARPSDSTPTPTPMPENPTASTDTAPVDIQLVLKRCSGKASLATTILKQFAAQSSDSVARMNAAAADPKELARLAHGIKGTAAMAGAEAVRYVAARIEDLVAAGDPALQDVLASLDIEVRRCQAFLDTAALPQLAAMPDATPRRAKSVSREIA